MLSAIADAAQDQIVGRRAEQQDMLADGLAKLDDGRVSRLFVLADGMGGHRGGATAATLAVDSFLATAASGLWPTYPELMRHALLAANRAVGEHARQNPAQSDMGCTLVAALLDGFDLLHISVGDSLLLRFDSSGLVRLNADHSMAPLIDGAVAQGRMTPAEAEEHPQRSALRSAVTGRPIAMIDEGVTSLRGGETIILASDGLLSLSPPEIADILADTGLAGTAGRTVARLLDEIEARARADQDNSSIALFTLHPQSAPTPASEPLTRARKALGWTALLCGLVLAGAAAFLVTRSGMKWPMPGDPDREGLTTIASDQAPITSQGPVNPAVTAPQPLGGPYGESSRPAAPGDKGKSVAPAQRSSRTQQDSRPAEKGEPDARTTSKPAGVVTTASQDETKPTADPIPPESQGSRSGSDAGPETR